MDSAEFSTRLFENADILKRYLRNNSIAAGLLFPMAFAICLVDIPFRFDASSGVYFDFCFWTLLFSIFGFYAAARDAFPDDFPCARCISALSAAMWVLFTAMVGFATSLLRSLIGLWFAAHLNF